MNFFCWLLVLFFLMVDAPVLEAQQKMYITPILYGYVLRIDESLLLIGNGGDETLGIDDIANIQDYIVFLDFAREKKQKICFFLKIWGDKGFSVSQLCDPRLAPVSKTPE